MKTADLVDDFDDEVSLCDLPFRRFGRKAMFHGPVATIKCHEDNALIKSTLQTDGRGRVLVVDAGGSTRCAVLGDMIATFLLENGWAGIVINGSIRDSADIDEMEIGVFALGTTPKKSAKAGHGQTEITIQMGGASFSPGDWVYCDHDGVLVSSRQLT